MGLPMKRPDSEDATSFVSMRGALGVLVALAATAFAASGSVGSAPASHDADVIRTVGLGWTGAVGGLERLASAAFVVLPIGTRVLRAALASALACGACAFFVYDLAERFARAALAPVLGAAPRLVPAVAAAAALGATLGGGFQGEARAPSGAMFGALLVLAALREAARGRATEEGGPRPAAAALLLGLAVNVDALTLAATALAFAPHVSAWASRLRKDRGVLAHVLASFGVGLLPLVASFATRARAPELALAAPFDAGFLPGTSRAVLGPSLVGARRGLPALASFVTSQIGPVVVVAAGAAAVLVAWALRSRGAAKAGRAVLDAQLAIAGVVAVGIVSVVQNGAGASSGVALAAVAAVHAEAAVTLAAAALAIARAPVPFAQASATLVVVLEMVLPVRAADEALGQREATPRRATEVWTSSALEGAPPAAALLAFEPALVRRLAAARATGELRGDLLVVSPGDVRSRLATRALAVEPKLAPLFRDLALGSPPEELSLGQLASARAVLVAFERTWDRALGRHLAPVGLFSSFEPEPRGVVDRKRAFDAFTSVRERLVRGVVARRDPDLVALTASLLRARALGVATTGDRELLSRALDDLRPFAPDDAVAAQLVRRIVTSKGPIDVRDLSP